MFGNLGQLMDLAKRAGEIKKNVKKFREEMAKNEFSASAGGDAVKVVVSGDLQIKSIAFGSTAPFSDPELLADLVKHAANNAVMTAKNAAAEGLKEATGGMDMGDFL